MNLGQAINTAYKNPAPHQDQAREFSVNGINMVGQVPAYSTVVFGGDGEPEVCHIVVDMTPRFIEIGLIAKLKSLGFEMTNKYHKRRLADGMILYHFHFKRTRGGMHHAVGSQDQKGESGSQELPKERGGLHAVTTLSDRRRDN